MFTITASHNPYLRPGQDTMQAVLSISANADVSVGPAPLALAIALDRSGSMEGRKIAAAREGAIKVVQALDETMTFMVVTFNENAQVIFGPAPGTPENKQRAMLALQVVRAAGGTCMSKALNAVVGKFDQNKAQATRVLFLTDGKNEGERHHILDQAVKHCKAANISISAWGVGTDWDAAELRSMADQTYGTADIIPTPQQIEGAFISAFSEMRKTALTNVRMVLWSPVGVSIKKIEQVYPSIVALGLEPDGSNARQQIVSLGSFAAGEQHDYLVDFTMPVYPPGQQFVMLRPSLAYFAGGGNEQVEKSERTGWVFAQWTEDMALAAQIDPQVAHYTNQEELSQSIREGQEALASGNRERAKQLLGHALEISQRSNNERITKLLSSIVYRDAKGTIQLNQQADAVARKTLAINVGRTTKLK